MKKHWAYVLAALVLVIAGAGLVAFLEDSTQERDPQIVDLSIPPRSGTDEGIRRIPLDPGLSEAHEDDSALEASADSDE